MDRSTFLFIQQFNKLHQMTSFDMQFWHLLVKCSHLCKQFTFSHIFRILTLSHLSGLYANWNRMLFKSEIVSNIVLFMYANVKFLLNSVVYVQHRLVISIQFILELKITTTGRATKRVCNLVPLNFNGIFKNGSAHRQQSYLKMYEKFWEKKWEEELSTSTAAQRICVC